MAKMYILEHAEPGPAVVDLVVKLVSCGICGVRGVARVGSYTVRFTKQYQLADITRTPESVIVRQSVIDHLTEALVSGWRQGPLRVEAVPELRGEDLSFSELVIVGHTRGYAEHLGLEIEDLCDECGRRVYAYPEGGITIPEECWDGSDVFVIDELPGIRVVTETFRQVIEKHRHTGAIFVPTDEWRDPLAWIR